MNHRFLSSIKSSFSYCKEKMERRSLKHSSVVNEVTEEKIEVKFNFLFVFAIVACSVFIFYGIWELMQSLFAGR